MLNIGLFSLLARRFGLGLSFDSEPEFGDIMAELGSSVVYIGLVEG